jgi:protocatechuate 3,4-dioxygenase beta subunit
VGRVLWLLVAVVACFALAVQGAPAAPAAQSCRPTPTDAFGPFGRGTPPFRARIGTGHVLTGVVLSSLDCRPLARARVELWQANRNGRYTRAGSASVLTDRDGRFRFEGPYPPSYEGRPGHIHLRIFARGHEALLARYVPARGARRGSMRLVLRPALV